MNDMFLYHGDCLQIMQESSFQHNVDIVFTSPPYNRKRNDKYDNYDDSIGDYFKFLCDVIDICINKVSKYVFFNIQSTYYNRVDVYKLIGKYADILQNIIIWEKSNPLPASGNNITNAYEFFLVLGKNSLQSNNAYTKNIITTAVNTEGTTSIHKAVMKQEVADWFITTFTKKEDVVLDPFMGLGTTGISCKRFNRKFIGIEIDETYYNVAQNRIENTPISLF
jgi:DNA modification methylase